VEYVDSNYVGDLDDRKSTTRYVFTFGGELVCWKFIIQFLVTMSTTQAKYTATTKASKEVVWLAGLV